MPEYPHSQKDFNGNYFLGYGLSYFAVDAKHYFDPSLVDYQSLLGIRKAKDRATDEARKRVSLLLALSHD